jgi:uncharacterized membrane-anchored protein
VTFVSRAGTWASARLAAGAATALAIVLAQPAFAETPQQHDRAAAAAFRAMHWKKGTQKLSASHGTFVVPRNGTMLVGSEATRADQLINGASDPSVEGFAEFAHRSLYVSYVGEGFVTADDWKDVNADDLMKNIKDGTEQANAERAKAGVGALHVDGWVQKPTFDANRKSVRWVTHAHDDAGRTIVNAVAMQLGRQGYERFTLVSNGKDPNGDAALLSSAAGDYSFDPGFRFSDYVKGDKLAGYGIAALVGTAAGATIAKTVGFGALLRLVKKFFLVIIAVLVGAFRYLRGMFGRKPAGPGPGGTIASG